MTLDEMQAKMRELQGFYANKQPVEEISLDDVEKKQEEEYPEISLKDKPDFDEEITMPPLEEVDMPRLPTQAAQQASALPSFMKQMRPRQINVPSTGEANFNLQQLKDAQSQRDDAQLANRLGMAASTIGHALTRTKADPSESKVFEANIAAAEKPIEDIKAKVEMEKFDPKSQTSQVYRKLMERFGVKLGDTVSAEDVTKAFPIVAKAAEQELTREANLTKAKYLADVGKERRETNATAKKEKEFSDNALKMNQQFNQMLGGKGALAKPNQVSQSADRLEGLVAQYGTKLDDMPPQQVAEFVQAFNTMITQGQGNMAVFKKLLPKNISMEGANVAQWITSDPQGAGQKKFLETFLNSARTEKNIAEAQKKEGLIKHANAFKNKVKDEDLADFKRINGITEEDEQMLKPGELIKKSMKQTQKTSEKLSPEQSNNLSIFMKNNPRYSREEAIEKLKTSGHF